MSAEIAWKEVGQIRRKFKEHEICILKMYPNKFNNKDTSE